MDRQTRQARLAQLRVLLELSWDIAVDCGEISVGDDIAKTFKVVDRELRRGDSALIQRVG